MKFLNLAARLCAGAAMTVGMGIAAQAQTANLNPNADPWENFDLSDWALDTPTNDDGGASRTNEYDLANGNLNKSEDSDYFYTHSDGGMRFETRLGGRTTGDEVGNTDQGSFVRSELREMLRDCPSGNNCPSTRSAENNWALVNMPSGGDWAGRGTRMKASLRVNKVSTTGDYGENVGKVMVGQIHAKDDEPLRIYYRKMPNWTKGCMYLAHEIQNGDDEYISVLGGSACEGSSPEEPSNGIALNELFSYKVVQVGNRIVFYLYKGDLNENYDRKRTINMVSRNSGYYDSDEFMYLKAGAYSGNDTGDSNDGEITTFYYLSNAHTDN